MTEQFLGLGGLGGGLIELEFRIVK